MKEILFLFIIIESGFILGAIGMYKGSQSVTAQIKYQRWKKYISYLIIIHFMICSILIDGIWFVSIYAIICVVSFFEIIYVSLKHMGYLLLKKITAVISVFFFLIISTGSIVLFYFLNKNFILFIYIIIAVLDAYSQIIGQIAGKHKLAPKISPNKTIEGAIGGIICAILTGIILHRLIDFSITRSIIISIIISISGILGDILSSLYKRQCNIKDYSNILPGQGGMLDRFNSFIFSLFVTGSIFLLYKLQY